MISNLQKKSKSAIAITTGSITLFCMSAAHAVVVKVDVAKRGLLRLLSGWFESACFEGYRD